MNIFRLLGMRFRRAHRHNNCDPRGQPLLTRALVLRGLIPPHLHSYSIAEDEDVQRASSMIHLLLVPFWVAEVTYRAARAYHSNHKRST